jgi:hypothetical protein
MNSSIPIFLYLFKDFSNFPSGQLDMANPQIEPPPGTVEKKILGKIKEYHFLKTVNSVDELDKFRFQVIRK